jgi:hypothetical protein
VKVISEFEFFMLTFACELVMELKVVVIDAELDSASNVVLFEGGRRAVFWTLGGNTR